MIIRRIVLACVLAVPFFATAADAAQYIVVEARGIGMKPGTVVDPTKPLVLQQGQHLTLISDSGQTIKLDGPYQKAPAAEQGIQLAAAFSGLVTERNARTAEIGTTRGVGKVTLPDPWLLDATHSGNVCLQQGQPPILWRPSEAAAEADVAILPVDRSWKAQTTWPKGDDRLVVKNDMGMHGDASYFVVLNGNESAMTVNTVPAALSTDQMRAAWMLQKGCGPQAEALMRASR